MIVLSFWFLVFGFFWDMVKVKRFEDLKVWQLSRELCQNIHILSVDSELGGDFSLKRQINTSSGSVMDNIAEGFGRSGNKEFIYFLSVAKGSLYEVKSQLYRLLDKQYINDENFQILYDKTESLGKMLNGLIRYLRNSNYTGSKFQVNEDQLYYGKAINDNQPDKL